MDLGIKAGDHVLLVWTQPSAPSALQEMAEGLIAVLGADGKVSVVNEEILSTCECFTLYCWAVVYFLETLII